MILSPRSPRGSFSVPVNINLQGARRRQTREIPHQHQRAQVQEVQGRRCGHGRGSERAKSQTQVSSVGEDRAILLGFSMMAFSILMYFVVGITVVKPCLDSDWGEETNCTLVQVDFLTEGADCRGMSSYPCLEVFVNITLTGKRVRLHYNEEAVNLSPKCFYTPKCQRDQTDLLMEAEKIKQVLEERLANALPCHLSQERHPDSAILQREHIKWLALKHQLWPSLMLAGGVLLVGLVKLNQHLAHMCSELGRESGEDKRTALVQGRLYRLLRW